MKIIHSLCAIALGLAACVHAQGSLTKIEGSAWAGGAKPKGVDMFLYAPPNLPPNAPIVVAIHYCLGSAAMYQRSANFIPSAQQYKFAVIYPQNAVTSEHCWQVNSAETLIRGGGGDADSIMKMVNYTASKHQSDLKRVYVLGSSSGGMMTNVMMATYPDKIAKAASFSGIPYACLKGSKGAGPMSDNSPCVKGTLKKSGAEWAALVKEGTKGEYKGEYPPIQIWHQTKDSVVNFALQQEQVKQWTTVAGISDKPTKSETGVPKAGTTKQIYGDGSKVVAFTVNGAGHPCPVDIPEVLRWFDIAK